MVGRAIRTALLLSTLPAAGCGTVANLVRPGPAEGGKAPFGGVRQDLWCIRTAGSGDFGVRAHAKSEPERYPQVALMLLCAADLPLSLVGDVVTWPYAVVYSFVNQPIPTSPVGVAGAPVALPIPGPPVTPPIPIPPVPPVTPPAAEARPQNAP
jgi:uncharacterized protein YceK